MATGKTTTTNGNLNINVTAPEKYTTVQQRGQMPLNTYLNVGMQ